MRSVAAGAVRERRVRNERRNDRAAPEECDHRDKLDKTPLTHEDRSSPTARVPAPCGRPTEVVSVREAERSTQDHP